MSSDILIFPWISNSFFAVITFYLFSLILTFAGLPFCVYIFKKRQDLGLPFAKLISLILITYLAWIGGNLKIMAFTQLTLYCLLLALILLSIIFIFHHHSFFKINFFKNNFRLILQEEIIFLLFFLVFIFIRYGNPDLWHPYMGGEKPMDFAFLNSLIRTKYFPPLDPWFAQGTINYYYFGTLLIATLTKLTSILPSISYNIALAFLFAQSAATIFSLVYNYSKSRLKSFFACLLGVVIGNLAQLPVILKNFSSPIPINDWYWTASRVMRNGEINEFPYFSFIYADLHAHLISFCLAILIIAVGLSLFESIDHKNITTMKVIFLAFLVGIIRISNTWDFPTYMLYSVITLVICFIIKRPYRLKNVLFFLFMFLLLGALSIFFVLPFLLNYHSGPLGLSFYHGPRTAILDYLKIHGLFLYILIGYLLALIISRRSSVKNINRFLPLFLFIFAIGLTAIPDIFEFSLGLGRMNTVFKFYFQAWLFFSLASGFSLQLIFTTFKKHTPVLYHFWNLGFIVLFSISLLYPITATPAKIKDRMSPFTPNTLDGMLYMKYSSYFDNGKNLILSPDYAAINWINKNIPGQPVILEAQTPIYRWGSRVSIYTGLPTVIGWDWHETAHRSYLKNNEISTRVQDVANAYNTPSVDILKDIVRKYQIKYIYVGGLEAAYYQSEGLAKFPKLAGNYLQTIYQNDDTIIYQVVN